MPGLSPHAPYSVSMDLFQSLAEIAVRERVPLCLHLAETPAELEILESGTGEFVEMLAAFGLWREDLIPCGTRPIDFLRGLADVETALVAHGNYFADDEIRWLGEHPNVSTVFCPRTHHFFGHPAHPWLKLIEAGASVSIGTDGRSSNPDYSLWNELRFLDERTNGFRRQLLLELGTIQGAAALGRQVETGTITVGKRADFSVISLPENDCTDPWSLLFAPGSKATSFAGTGSSELTE